MQTNMLKDLKRSLQVIVKSGQPHHGCERGRRAFRVPANAPLGAVYDEAHKAHLVDAAPRLAVALKEGDRAIAAEDAVTRAVHATS